MTSEHAVKAPDTDLREPIQLLAEMGGLVERQINDVIEALLKRHTALARRVIASDAEVDAFSARLKTSW